MSKSIGDVQHRRGAAKIGSHKAGQGSGQRRSTRQGPVLRQPEQEAQRHAGARLVAELAPLLRRDAAVNLIEVGSAALGQGLECSLVLPVDDVREGAPAVVGKDQAMKLAAHHAALGLRRMLQQPLQQGAGSRHHLTRIKFAERGRQAWDWLREWQPFNMPDREPVKIEHRAFEKGRAEINADVLHRIRL